MPTISTMDAPYHFSRRTVTLRCAPRPEPDDDPDAPCPQIVNPEAKERLCLKCRRPFLSTWAGHRLCSRCRLENLGIGMPNGVAPPRCQADETSLDD